MQRFRSTALTLLCLAVFATGASLVPSAACAGPKSKNVTRTSVNKNVNVNNNVNKNVNVNSHRDVDIDVDVDHDHNPIGTAIAVGATVAITAAVVGSIVSSVPPSCVPVQVGAVLYQQCGTTWYQPQYMGTTVQYVVVNPPRY